MEVFDIASSPVELAHRKLPRQTIDQIRLEEKRRYRDELKDAIGTIESTNQRLRNEVNQKSRF
jgi:hypothetical protein